MNKGCELSDDRTAEYAYKIPLDILLQNQLKLQDNGEEECAEALEDIRGTIFDDSNNEDPTKDEGEIDMLEDFVAVSLSTGTCTVPSTTLNSSEQQSLNSSGNSSIQADEIKNKGEEQEPRIRPLYNNSHVTLETALLIVCLFMIKHNLTHTAMDDLLSVLTYLLPIGNIMASSFNEFKKLFSKLKYPIVLHYYCSFCLMPIADKKITECPNLGCQHKLISRDSKSYFIEIPIVSQVQSFLERTGFYNNLQHRFKRKIDGSVRDVYDGKLYKSRGILSSGDNISFMFNTDGAPVFKSSKMSIWPIYLVINELPINIRFNKENMILAGLWFGSKKPFMLSFLKPIVKELEKLENGVEMKCRERGTFTMRAILLACICDLPARAILMNFVQYNGAYCCAKCLQRGESTASGKGHAHTFSFQDDNPKGPARSDASVKEAALKSHEQLLNNKSSATVDGVKGISLLMGLKYFDTVKGTGIDYMHGTLLGVQKLLLNLWLSQRHSKEAFSIFKNLDDVEKRISQLKPPSNIKRAPRSIQETLKYWKASEFRAFLLYYGVPVLNNILPSHLFQHYILLVQATFLLLKDGITEADFQEAETCLIQFVQLFQCFYGLCFATLNLHQLLHLVDDCRELGPLYTHDCFSYEDKNRIILSFIHGTQCVASQIINAVAFAQQIPDLLHSYFSGKCQDAIELLQQLNKGYTHVIKEEIVPKIYRLGAYKTRMLLKDEIKAVEDYLGYAVIAVNCRSFTRLLFKGKKLIYGQDYCRMICRNNSVVKLSPNRLSILFLTIIRFLHIELNGRATFYCIGKPLVPKSDYNERCHITIVNVLDHLVAIPVEIIKDTCVYLKFSEDTHAYVCEFPNNLDLN